MSKSGTTKDWRVKYIYQGVRRYEPELDIEWIDTSGGSYTHTWVDPPCNQGVDSGVHPPTREPNPSRAGRRQQ